jgi:hypothetical protein
MSGYLVGTRTLLATILIFVAAAACAQTPSPASQDVIDAIWRVEQFDFNYRSARGFYACDELQARLARMLISLGAHESAKVELRCTGGRLVSNVRAHISVAVPVEATRENVQAATTFDARARLLARLGRYGLPTAAHVQHFPAAWRRVYVTANGRRRFGASECELLSQVQQQIFPQLRVRSSVELYCMPWATHVTQTLEVKTLVRIAD